MEDIVGNNIYRIYQIREEAVDRHELMFESYDFLQKHGYAVKAANYKEVYSGRLEEEMQLDDLFEKFNTDHPSDFRGHSMSVSDVIVTRRNGKEDAWYVDSFGFRPVPEFLEGLKEVQNAAV